MNVETVGDKLVLKRTNEEKIPLKQRLNRVEGQIRGLKQMIEDNRYCGEAIQQISASIAGLREVSLMLISQQLHEQAAQIEEQKRNCTTSIRESGMTDFVDMLRLSYRFV